MAAVAYLRAELGAATAPGVAHPIGDWIAAEIDMLHALNVRDWTVADRALDHGNDLVDPIVAACGLR
jgi:hypothetical protein